MTLTDYRHREGLSQQALSVKVGIKQSRLSYIENGRPASKRDAARIHLATGGEVDLGTLLYPEGVEKAAGK